MLWGADLWKKPGAGIALKSCSRLVLCVITNCFYMKLQLRRRLTHIGGLCRPHHIYSGRCGSSAVGCMFLHPGRSLQNDLQSGPGFHPSTCRLPVQYSHDS